MKKLLVFLFMLGLSVSLFGQVTFILKSTPDNTPRNSKFYLAGTINDWQPNLPDFEFTEDKFGSLSLTIETVPDTFEYKICRGDWTSVEVDSAGRDIINRMYVDSIGTMVMLNVHNWRDRMNPKQLVSTASKNVFFTPTSIEIPQLDRRRTVRVYFPPNYSSRQGFPVVYLLDGQNVFDKSTAFADEWKVDEVMDSLFQQRGLSCIVIAVYHGEEQRINEYTPWENDKKEGGDGEKFAKFIVKDLKPYIDKYYRVIPDRENTTIIGSSMGGLMALYLALEYPKIFGKVAVFSPTLSWSPDIFTKIEKFKKRNFQKIYMYAGMKEDSTMVRNIRQADQLLKDVGFSENELILNLEPYGRNSEIYWGHEYTKAISWFFNFKP
ncbi:MAG: alpha/beta hydrolase-fold protein [Bacteroidales bacterium]